MLNQMILWPVLVAAATYKKAQLLPWVRAMHRNRDERGASLVEYALLLALIAVVAVASLVLLGHSVSNTLNQVGNQINSTYSTTTTTGG